MQQQQPAAGGPAARPPPPASTPNNAGGEGTPAATTAASTAANPPAQQQGQPGAQNWNAARPNERQAPDQPAPAAPQAASATASAPNPSTAATAEPAKPAAGTPSSGSSAPAPLVFTTTAASAKPITSGTPRTAAVAAQAAGTPTSNLRPLNVKDALSYLDQVKSKYKYSPEVYNAFLDVMKDFKTQVIDTPGVIDRVSSLFRNCPILIANFNLFLPDGYKIEAVVKPADPEYIDVYRVVTPYTTQQLSAGQSTSLTGVILPGQVKRYQQQAQARIGSAPAQGTPAQQATAAATTSTVQQAASGAAASQPAPAGRLMQIHRPPQSTTTGAGRGKPAASSAQPSAAAAQVKQEPATSTIPANKSAAAVAPLASQQAASTVSAQSAAQDPRHGQRQAGSVNEPDNTAQQPQPPSQSASAQPSRTATPGAASALSNSTDSRRPPIEFNHAISYVNKIKNRFIREPEVYKTFLDILQTYQKEQRPIQDVYAQVTKLFKAAPDLLEEFKQFLPDHSAQGQADAAAAAQAKAAAQARAAGATAGAAAPGGARPAGPATTAVAGAQRQIPAEEPTSAAAAAQKRKRAAGGQVDKGPELAPPASVPAGFAAGKGKQQPGRKVGKGAAAGIKDPVIPAQQSSARYDGIISAQSAYPQPILSYLPPGYTLPGFGGTASVSQGPPPTSQMTNEERLFFDRVADFIDDKFTYYEFLKLLNLYTQDIIDLPTLVSRAWLFIGSAPDLWLDFRHLVGWQDGSSVNGRTIENGEWIVENIPAVERKGPDLSKAESAGPSYRKLPPSEINMQCSGRDKLCWEVLNDEWVSVMSLGSEEVFLAHRKNPFEEALHRSEEERHEYDFHIEANLRTIALLEPIAAKIATMSPKERETFRLKPGLGGQSKSLYQRIIKKVYGREIGREVIAALHENPCVSVPIVLARLKQKDEEWKRALREWNRVWREVDAKNFYRSLDHQGITFKAQDKRYINPKSLVTEIEVLRRTEMQKQIAAPLPYRPPAATYQLAYPISDETVLFDSLKLFLSYLDRAPGYHTLAERDRIEAFLRSLTSLVFAIPVSVLDAMLTPVQDDDHSGSLSEDDMSDSAASSVDGSSAQPNGRRAGSVTGGNSNRKNGDLRKKALKNAGHGEAAAIERRAAKNGLDGADAMSASSRDATPVPASHPTAATESTNEDTPMDGVESAEGVTPTVIVEQEANGDSTFKTEVPASAAGLDGMSGVETIKTAVASATGSIEQAQHPRQPSATPVIRPDAPPETMQTAHDVVENGPIVPAVIAGDSPIEDASQQAGQSTPVLHNAQRDGQHQIRRFNFFCNTPYYCAIRLLQLLYSRLDTMKQAAKALEKTKSESALQNTAYTTFGKANPRFSGQEAPTPEFLYDSMLELCEKLFGSEIDQPTFEDGIRALFGNQAYHIFTIDKLLSSLVKTVWSLIDSNRETYAANGEIFKLLVDDRRYPTTAQAQQVSYRINAELAAGSDEHLYRIEWLPRRHQLTFQLLGKDEVLPEDEGDLSKAWERYIESFVGDTVTKGVALSENELLRTVCLRRNLKATKEADGMAKTQVLAKSELESRICMRSYRMFWQGKTEDAMHREWSEAVETSKLEDLENKRKNRFSKWLEKRNATLSEQHAARESSQAATTTEVPQTTEAEKKDAPAPASIEATSATEAGDVTMEDVAPAESPVAKNGDVKEAEKKEEPQKQETANEAISAPSAPAATQSSA